MIPQLQIKRAGEQSWTNSNKWNLQIYNGSWYAPHHRQSPLWRPLLMMRMHIATFTRGVCHRFSVTGFVYWYQGVLRTQRSVHPASVRILMEAASASLTVSFTDCIRFWALWTNISVAWSGKHSEVKQSGVKWQQRWEKMKTSYQEEVFSSSGK